MPTILWRAEGEAEEGYLFVASRHCQTATLVTTQTLWPFYKIPTYQNLCSLVTVWWPWNKLNSEPSTAIVYIALYCFHDDLRKMKVWKRQAKKRLHSVAWQQSNASKILYRTFIGLCQSRSTTAQQCTSLLQAPAYRNKQTKPTLDHE